MAYVEMKKPSRYSDEVNGALLDNLWLLQNRKSAFLIWRVPSAQATNTDGKTLNA